MKNILMRSLLQLILLSSVSFYAQVGIGTTTPNLNSLLDVESTNKGFLLPRLTTTERNTLGTQLLITPDVKEKGMLVFDTNLTSYYYWNGTAWVSIVAVGGDYVDLTTNQTIAGNKTFTGDFIPTGRMILPMGEISYFSTTGTLISITSVSNGTNNMLPVGPITALTTSVHEFSNGGTNNGTLQYIGTTTKMFHIAVTISGTPASPNDIYVFGVALNGTVITTGKVLGSSSTAQFSSLHIMLDLNTNDKIQLQIGNISGARNFTVKSLNFFAMGL